MFTGKVLNSEAKLNSWKELSAVTFIPGSSFKFVFQILDDQTKTRHIFPETAVIKISVNNIDDERTEFTTSALDPSDRSMRYVQWTPAETAELNGGNIFFTVDVAGDGSGEIYKGYLSNPLAKAVEGSC